MHAHRANNRPPSDLRRSLRLITLGGCLAMVYSAGINSPAFTDFYRALGARPMHFGLLNGLPLVMVVCQFAGALLANRIRRRKPWFIGLIVLGRLLHLPAVLLPLALPGARHEAIMTAVVALTVASAALVNTVMPLWFSWMADVIPARRINSYWGTRQLWMHVAWTVAYLAVAAFTYGTDLPALVEFPILAGVAVAAGVADILLFLGVREPRAPPHDGEPAGPGLRASLLEPLRHREYRVFVAFSCAWAASAMFAAGFMMLYVLEGLAVPRWEANLVWSTYGIGIALVARGWGRLADRYGQRPVLRLCIALKPLIAVVFLLITRESVLWVLPAAFLFDSMLNAGIMTAQNGYMLRFAPRRNRSMFVAFITGFAGICGGLAVVAGGGFLKLLSGFRLEWAGREWNNYHLLFLASLFMRVACIFFVRLIREPNSSSSRDMLSRIVADWPLRPWRFSTAAPRE